MEKLGRTSQFQRRPLSHHLISPLLGPSDVVPKLNALEHLAMLRPGQDTVSFLSELTKRQNGHNSVE